MTKRFTAREGFTQGWGNLGPKMTADSVRHICPEDLEPSCNDAELDGDTGEGRVNMLWVFLVMGNEGQPASGLK